MGVFRRLGGALAVMYQPVALVCVSFTSAVTFDDKIFICDAFKGYERTLT